MNSFTQEHPQYISIYFRLQNYLNNQSLWIFDHLTMKMFYEQICNLPFVE